MKRLLNCLSFDLLQSMLGLYRAAGASAEAGHQGCTDAQKLS